MMGHQAGTGGEAGRAQSALGRWVVYRMPLWHVALGT